MLRLVRGLTSAAGLLSLTLLAGCTTGDGEGPRYIGLVVSVSPINICVGPSTSSSSVTCGGVPAGATHLPRVGQCVGLFPGKLDAQGHVVEWSTASLRLHYADSECAGHSS
jgi:hypothetical protein